MEEAIKAIRSRIELLRTTVEIAKRNFYKELPHFAGIPDTQLSDKAIGDMERLTEAHIANLQAAISHLKRKVKRDPRVDGLPEPDQYQTFICFLKNGQVQTMEYLNGNRWYDKCESEYTTDEILFYADPNEIV